MAYQMNMDAFRNGQQLYESALNRERQNRLDARAEEEFGWRREEQQRERDFKTQLTTGLGLFQKDRSTDEADSFVSRISPGSVADPSKPITTAIDSNVVASDKSNPVESNVTTGETSATNNVANPAAKPETAPESQFGKLPESAATPAQGGAPSTPSATPPAVPATPAQEKDPRRAWALSQAKAYAGLGAKGAGMFEHYTKEVARIDDENTVAEIHRRVAADPKLQMQMANHLSANSSYPMNAQLDTKTGKLNLRMYGSGDAVSLTPEQAGIVASSMYRMQKGDMTGYEKIKGINAELATAAYKNIELQLKAQDRLVKEQREQRLDQLTQAQTASALANANHKNALANGTIPTGKSGKAPLTPLEETNALISKQFKPKDDPTAITRATEIAAQSFGIDPSIAPAQRAFAAQEAATNSPNVSPRLDFGSGKVVATHINSSSGVKTPLYEIPANKLAPKDAEAFKSEVSAFISEQNVKAPGLGDLLNQAATGNQSALGALPIHLSGMAKQNLVSTLKDYVSKKPGSIMPSDAEIDARVQQLVANQMPTIKRSIDLIRMYGK